MAAMLRELVADIADELIAALPPMLGRQGRTGCARACTAGCGGRGCWSGDGLVALLLRRADEQQLAGIGPTAANATLGGAGRRRRRPCRRGGDGAWPWRGDAGATASASLVPDFDDLAGRGCRGARPCRRGRHCATGLGRRVPTSRSPQRAQALLARHDEGRRLEADRRGAGAGTGSVRPRRRRNGSQAGAGRRCGAACRASRPPRRNRSGSMPGNCFTGGDAMMLARLAGCDRAAAAQILAGVRADVGSPAPRNGSSTGSTAIDDARGRALPPAGCGSTLIIARHAMRLEQCRWLARRPTLGRLPAASTATDG